MRTFNFSPSKRKSAEKERKKMEILGTLFFASVVIYLISLPLKGERLPFWYHLLPFASIVFAAAQLTLEGFRWQSAALYILSILIFLLTLPNFISGLRGNRVGRRTKTWIRIVGLAAGIILCALSLLASLNFPRFKFPTPTGEYAVGTNYVLLTDGSRSDFVEGSPGDSRTISVRAWYPARKNPAGKPCQYQKAGSAESIARLFQMPPFLLNYLSQIQTHSYENAKMPETDKIYPVIIFSPSAWMNQTTAVNEELASHGFVVLAVGHTSTEPFIYDSEGNIKPLDSRSPYHFKLRQELYSDEVESIKDQIIRCTEINSKRELHQRLNRYQPANVEDIQMRAADIRFLIDKLPEINTSVFSGKLDPDRIGVFGFSKGGATAGEVCVTDTRVEAGLNMDGFMYGDIVDTPLKRPFMFMHSTPAVEAAFINDWFYREAQNTAYMLKIKGTTHSNFGDLSLFGGIFKKRGVLGGIDGGRCVEIQRAYVLAFFDKHLRGNDSPLLDIESMRYPEVEFVMKSDDMISSIL
jgi:predicted dienelactone hydrolase